MKKGRRNTIITIFTAAALALVSSTAFAGWTMTDLSTWSGMTGVGSYGLGINNNGDVVGGVYISVNNSTHNSAAVWSDGAVTNLGSSWNGYSTAVAITDTGLIVGSTPGGQFLSGGATLWTGRNYSYLDPADLLTTQGGKFADTGRTSPADINNAGVVVGQTISYYDNHAAVWSDGTIRSLAAASEWSGATAINNNGQIVGFVSELGEFNGAPANGPAHATLWDSVDAQPVDLGILEGGYDSYATGISDSGQVVGKVFKMLSDYSSAYYAATWKQANGVWTGEYLPILDGFTMTSAEAVNSAGVIVGTATDTTGGLHAVMWKDGTMFDLNNLGINGDYTFITAMDINDAGQIVGTAINKDGIQVAYSVTPTPIPAALPLFGSGLAAVGLIRRRFRRA